MPPWTTGTTSTYQLPCLGTFFRGLALDPKPPRQLGRERHRDSLHRAQGPRKGMRCFLEPLRHAQVTAQAMTMPAWFKLASAQSHHVGPRRTKEPRSRFRRTRTDANAPTSICTSGKDGPPRALFLGLKFEVYGDGFKHHSWSMIGGMEFGKNDVNLAPQCSCPGISVTWCFPPWPFDNAKHALAVPKLTTASCESIHLE